MVAYNAKFFNGVGYRYFMCAQDLDWVVTPKDGVNYAFEFDQNGSFIGLVPANTVIDDSSVKEVIADFTGDNFVFVIGDETISYNGVELSPSVVSYRFAELEGGEVILPVSLRIMNGTSEIEGVVEESNNVPVIVDSEGGLHVLKNTATSSKFYGSYALRNVPGGLSAWWPAVSVPGAATACLSGDYEVCSFLTWLYSQGLNGQIMYDYD